VETMPFIPPTQDELIEGLRRYTGISEINNREIISSKLSQCATEVLAVLEPRSILKKTMVSGCNAGTLVGKGVSIESKKLSSMVATMNQPAFIYGFALTLGEQIDGLIEHSQRISLAEALILDAAGSFLVEHYASLFEDCLVKELSRQGLQLSTRFSPGYCDWDLKHGQAELSRFLSPHVIGIDLRESGLMSPMKSITGIFIVASSMPERTPCAFCLDQDCPHRR
jgi:hypothetical protein